ncbi:MAG: hypothetical protein ACYSTJ_08180 [Planctomycetota bacterium]
MKRAKIFRLACGAFLVLGGCAGAERFEAVEQICVGGIERSDAMRASEDVLGGMGFAIEKSDVESGFIRSRPLRGGQFFEFWRRDNRGSFNSAEANLHSVRRIVEIEIKERERQLCIGCAANVQRLNLAEHEVVSISRSYSMFSDSEENMQKLEVGPKQRRGMAWIELGRDARLETELLKRIEAKIDRKLKIKMQNAK